MADGCLLYYITDRTAFAPDEPTRRRRLLEKVVEAARAGVDYIQLREKDLSSRELELLAREVAALLKQLRTDHPVLRTRLLINSRTDIALATGADGVHLRSDDVAPQEVRTVWSGIVDAPSGISLQGPLLGISCHSVEDVIKAEHVGANFVVFAPVFEKKDLRGMPPAGLTQLRVVCKAKIPVLALGGITLENANSCLSAGAAGIAAIRLFQENDVASIVPSLRQMIP
jgi:thiamine-phosphate pyrophosphorylase